MKLHFIETNFLSAQASFENGRIVILGCPFDASASFRPGARFGPSAIRRASWGIETYSPYLDADLTDLSIHDMGDLELPLGEKEAALRIIRSAVGTIASENKFPALLGGDHLITLPVLEELHERNPDLHVVQIDAHTDLRQDYIGENLSHSTVMRKAADCLGEKKIFQIGVRSGTQEEFRLANLWKSLVPNNHESLQQMRKALEDVPVYLTVDLDVIDPGFLPGVGTPEPGGLTFQEFLAILKELRGLNVIGFDLVELTPDYDPTGISAVTASVILREILLTFCQGSDSGSAAVPPNG